MDLRRYEAASSPATRPNTTQPLRTRGQRARGERGRKDVQEGRATETVRAVNSSGNLSRGEKARDWLASGVDHARVVVNLESSHGVCAEMDVRKTAANEEAEGTYSEGRES